MRSISYLHLFETPESIRRRKRAKLLRVLRAKAHLLLSEGKVVPYPEVEDTYVVYPIIFMVTKHKGVWTCNCPRFKKLGICEDVLAVKRLEDGIKG